MRRWISWTLVPLWHLPYVYLFHESPSASRPFRKYCFCTLSWRLRVFPCLRSPVMSKGCFAEVCEAQWVRCWGASALLGAGVFGGYLSLACYKAAGASGRMREALYFFSRLPALRCKFFLTPRLRCVCSNVGVLHWSSQHSTISNPIPIPVLDSPLKKRDHLNCYTLWEGVWAAYFMISYGFEIFFVDCIHYGRTRTVRCGYRLSGGCNCRRFWLRMSGAAI